MSLIKRISDVFGRVRVDNHPGPESSTHRQRPKHRRNGNAPPKSKSNEDITTQFATAFETLDQTATGTEVVKEICRSLTDESEKLKRALAQPKKTHE